MYKRRMPQLSGILNYLIVDDIDKALAKVEKPGGKIAIRDKIRRGTAVILDT